MPALSNPLHEAFAQKYSLSGNASAVSRELGLGRNALAFTPEIEARVQEIMHQRFSKAGITAERTLREIARIAFASISDLYDDQGRLIPPHELPDDVAAAVSRIKVEIKGTGKGEERAETVLRDIKMADKMAALTILSRHFKIVGDDTEGVNALAGALADRLKAARQRVSAPETVDDARIVPPGAEPGAFSPAGGRQGARLEYALPGDPSIADDVTTPRLTVPVRNPRALHSTLPVARQVDRNPSSSGADHEDELW